MRRSRRRSRICSWTGGRRDRPAVPAAVDGRPGPACGVPNHRRRHAERLRSAARCGGLHRRGCTLPRRPARRGTAHPRRPSAPRRRALPLVPATGALAVHDGEHRAPRGIQGGWDGAGDAGRNRREGSRDANAHQGQPGALRACLTSSRPRRPVRAQEAVSIDDQGPTARSSECPASSRGHWAMGRPPHSSDTGGHVGEPPSHLMEPCCGQPEGESSQGSWRP